MSDPYNSYGSSLPPVVTAEPGATDTLRPRRDKIAELDVSEAWKRKFRLIEKAGGPDLPDFRSLTTGERLSAGFNILAFFFGPIYFVIKGLWRQATLYVVLVIALALLLEAMGLGKIARGVGYGLGVICAARANISYYKKEVLGERPWL